jgi:tetratricopeptide (TPR) repeat protein
MSDYIFGTTLSYRDYLQTKSFEDDIRSDISQQTRSIIASNEELQREHIKVLELSSTAVSSGFERLSFEVNALTAEISKLGSVFQWGFSELLMDTARLNDTLDNLLKVAKTPAQTWAYEQFEIARDAFKRGLYEDALDYINRAINGHGSQTGYKLEGRFHYLLGTIRLGDFNNNSPNIIDLAKAEQAFLDAAKYVTPESEVTKQWRIESGSYGFLKARGQAYLSCLAAGWAAYCQGKIDDAERHTQLALKSEFPAAYFQMAKIWMHKGSVEPAIESLRKAIKRDRGYSIKAASDLDFQSHAAPLNNLLSQLRDEAKAEAENLFKGITDRISANEALRLEGMHIAVFEPFRKAKSALSEASEALNHYTYYGYLDAISRCQLASAELQKALATFRSNAQDLVRRRMRELDQQSAEARIRSMPCALVTLMLMGVLFSFIMACTQCSNAVETRMRQDPRKAAFEKWQKEIRSAGYNPYALGVEDYRRLGYNFENLPQQYAGYNGPDPTSQWFSYFFGCLLFSIGIPVAVWQTQKARRVASLQQEKERLHHAGADIERSFGR